MLWEIVAVVALVLGALNLGLLAAQARRQKDRSVQDVMRDYGAFRREIRQILAELGVPSNLGWTDNNIIAALREKVLGD